MLSARLPASAGASAADRSRAASSAYSSSLATPSPTVGADRSRGPATAEAATTYTTTAPSRQVLGERSRSSHAATRPPACQGSAPALRATDMIASAAPTANQAACPITLVARAPAPVVDPCCVHDMDTPWAARPTTAATPQSSSAGRTPTAPPPRRSTRASAAPTNGTST
ncbi:hypothetical protein VV01_09010 [Luteipulveratus halotolerans]|uniref:Uncharacterized protein n=1 Tax=Luteipulveratus halotolerans TaxID=1631356 RepID=A0A0L6CHG0_9MICO|nr:hypothetical protein VV01_09010 [Luteipulveratus halotolerans]